MYKPVLSKQARSQALLNQRAYKRQAIRELSIPILFTINFVEFEIIVLLVVRVLRAKAHA